MSIDFSNLFFSRHGRVGRQDFWFGVIMLCIGGMVLGLIPVLGQLVALAAIWPWFCLLSQRLHDIGRSGRLAAVAIIPAAVGVATAALASFAVLAPALALPMLPLIGLAGVLSAIGAVISLVFVIWVGLSAGQTHANQWGRAPTALIELGR